MHTVLEALHSLENKLAILEAVLEDTGFHRVLVADSSPLDHSADTLMVMLVLAVDAVVHTSEGTARVDCLASCTDSGTWTSAATLGCTKDVLGVEGKM